MNSKPSQAFIVTSWVALAIGVVFYLIDLFFTKMQLNEKGFYLVVLLYGLFSVVSVQKSVRDKMEGIPVTAIYYTLSWVSTAVSILLLVIGLWNAEMGLTEKGFLAIAFLMSMFAAIAVQKNTRDNMSAEYKENK
ncbi:MAG: inner membrane protein YiaA [Spirochaetota bacterium]